MRRAGAAGLMLALGLGCGPGTTVPGRVVLVGVDAGTLPLVQELVAAGALPAFASAMENGVLGGLGSIQRELPFNPKRGAGWWSPLVWPSIASGKLPEVHGVIDFQLPAPGSARLCTQAGAIEARLALEPPASATALRIEWAMPPDGGWTVEGIALSARALAAPDATTLALPEAREPGVARSVVFRAVSSPARPLCLREVALLDARGLVVRRVHFAADATWFAEGFGAPTFGPRYGAGPQHRRVGAVWNIASDHGRKVAVVSWRDSWPAETVNGYYTSDRLGRHMADQPDSAIALDASQFHPPGLHDRVARLAARFPEVDAEARRTLLDGGDCEIPDRHVARVAYWSDWLAHAIALEFWDDDPDIDLLAVYYGANDSFGHMYQAHRDPERAPCPLEPPLVDRYYGIVDGFLADWLERLDERTTLVVVSDHGMVAGEKKGEHADNGIMLLTGRAIRRGAELHGAHVLDVAPLVLYLLDLPLASDMPGAPPWSVLEPEHLRRHRPESVVTHERDAGAREYQIPSEELEAELLERLRALGYLD